MNPIKNELRTVLNLSGFALGLVFFHQVFSKSILELGSSDKLFLLGSWKVLLAVPVYIVVYLLQMGNFHRILTSCFNHKIRAAGLIKSYSLSFIAKYIPGAIWGYLSRSELLTRHENVPAAYTWIASVIEIVITVLSGCTLIAVYYLMIGGAYLWLLPVVVIGLVLIWSAIPKSVRFAGRLLQKDVRINAIKLPFFDFVELFLNGCVQWLLLGIGMLIIANGMGEKLSIFDLKQLFGSIAAFTIAWLGGFVIPFLPNGMGIREMTLVRLLVTNLGMSAPIAGLSAVVSRVLLLLTELVFVIFASTLNSPGNASEK